MAKDGTNRGGARPGAGRPRKALADKIAEGNPGGRALMQIKVPDDLPDLIAEDMPQPSEILSARQKNGKPLGADKIYRDTWLWLKGFKCERLVSPALLEQYAMSVARWIQCEEAISTYGLLGKHPTVSNSPIQSPFVAMSQSFMKQAQQIWGQIYQIVRENCSEEVNLTGEMDMMEQLLRSRK